MDSSDEGKMNAPEPIKQKRLSDDTTSNSSSSSEEKQEDTPPQAMQNVGMCSLYTWKKLQNGNVGEYVDGRHTRELTSEQFRLKEIRSKNFIASMPFHKVECRKPSCKDLAEFGFEADSSTLEKLLLVKVPMEAVKEKTLEEMTIDELLNDSEMEHAFLESLEEEVGFHFDPEYRPHHGYRLVTLSDMDGGSQNGLVSSDEGKMNAPEPIKQKRLSDDTTSNSSSGSEEEQDDTPPPPMENVEERSGSWETLDNRKVKEYFDGTHVRDWTSAELPQNDEKMQEYLESFTEISGRYTRADPGYAREKDYGENPIPPIKANYRPRQYGRGGYKYRNQSGNNRGSQRGRGGSYCSHSDRHHGNYRGGSHYGNLGQDDRPTYGRSDNPFSPIEAHYRPRQYGRGGYSHGNQSGNNRGSQRGLGGSHYSHSDRHHGNYRGGSHYGHLGQDARPTYGRKDNGQSNDESQPSKRRRMNHYINYT